MACNAIMHLCLLAPRHADHTYLEGGMVLVRVRATAGVRAGGRAQLWGVASVTGSMVG